MAMLRQFSQFVARRPVFLNAPRLASGFKFRRSVVNSTAAGTNVINKNASFQRLRQGCVGIQREFCTHVGKQPAPPIVVVDYEELMQLTPSAINCLREAFMGSKAYGAVAVSGIPGYGEKRKRAFRAGIDLALKDAEGRKRAAAVNNTYPGWSGTPGSETHPLQSSFLFNVKEEVGAQKTNDYFGKNIFPNENFRKAFADLSDPMHEAALQVLRGCDVLVEVANGLEGNKWSADNRSLHQLALDGPALAGRFICYDSAFTREDRIFEDRDSELMAKEQALDDKQEISSSTWSPAAHAPVGTQPAMDTHVKSVGHASDGLASMRTHSTPVKSAGHAGDGLASMRTHSTPIKTAGHAGDGLASMRTHSTPIKSVGHAGDGLASMRTHSTPVKTAGHAGDGLASMRTHSTPVKTAGHAGDGLASMRTHSTPIKSVGHAGDGLASMRTHSTPIKSVGHAGDGLASMRTHSTPIKSVGHAGDGLASMRTHSTPVKSSGRAGDGFTSTRTQSTPATSNGMKVEGPAFTQTQAPTMQHSSESGSVRMHSTQMVQSSSDIMDFPMSLSSPYQEPEVETKNDDVGDYWLPWHIDSNFVTLIHKEMYAYESDASFAPEPEGAGVVFMNSDGETTKLNIEDDSVMILQIGAFGQIYSGGHINACRHAVLSTAPTGIARFNFCNFWYVPWDTVCHSAPGREQYAVSTGWNAMMDSSYLGISMRQSFAAFRKFMTSPEARLQFADSVRFKELAEVLPLPGKMSGASIASSLNASLSNSPELVLDVMTDLRCPISYISLLNLEKALQNLGLSESTTIRYHPVFLNPNVPKEGECLDDYLLREFGYSKEYARSENYPLRLLGLEAGVEFSPDRRVVNTFNAACMVEIAQEAGKQRQMVELLSRSYFEGAKDISDVAVLCQLAASIGLEEEEVRRRLEEVDGPLQKRVGAAYIQFSEKVDEVPHFMVREHVSGNGVEVGGRRSVENWEGVLEEALQKGRFVGMTIPGLNGTELRLTEANPTSPISMAANAQHGWVPECYPYSKEDFRRMDESPDNMMYAEPRFVHHLDDASLARLTNVYRSAFATAPPGFAVLDLCSSWTSHFPESMPKDARVVVHGLNAAEVKANMVATESFTQDLNENPILPLANDSFHFVTNALSVQYLTDPLAVFAEMHRVLKPGGMAIIGFSHRCFIEKAVNVWARETDDGEGHVHLISRHFQFGPKGGWKHISSVDVSPSHGDPMWLVTAVKSY